jgi:uncharacterized protein
MTNFIPIFPLELVVYPGEKLNLHIFEPRYKQLINDSFTNKKPFGIPTVLHQKIQEFGTLVQVEEISKVYDDGKMDVKTIATEVFSILELINELPEKLYSGAIVNYPTNVEKGSAGKMNNIMASIKELHQLINTTKDFKKLHKDLCSYDVAHHAGLSLEQEYELLQLMSELQRQEFLQRHLTKTIPMLQEIELLKEKIKLNGHFKHIKGL